MTRLYLKDATILKVDSLEIRHILGYEEVERAR